MKKRVVSLLITVLVTLTVHGQQNSGLSLKVKIDPKRVSKVAPAFIEVVLENKSGSDIALSQSVLRQLAGRWLFGMNLSSDLKKAYGKAWRAPDDTDFWILPAGKYVRLVSPAQFSGAWYGERDTVFVFYVEMRHKSFTKSAKQRYEEFAQAHSATPFYGSLKSNEFGFVMVGVKNDPYYRVLQILKDKPTDCLTPPWGDIWTARKTITASAPEYPFDDYSFCVHNSWSFPCITANLGKDPPFPQVLEKWLEECDNFIHRWQAEMPLACEFLLWRKVAVLYALGREAEAEALKQSIIAKEPNRCFFLELQWLKNTIKDLKENLQTNKEQQNNPTQPASPQPQQPEPKQESSTTKSHGVAAEQASPLPEQETETAERRGVRSERGIGVAERRPPVAQRSDNFWLWLTLFGLAAVFVFILLSRRR